MSSSTSVPNEVASEYMFLKSGVFFFKHKRGDSYRQAAVNF